MRKPQAWLLMVALLLGAILGGLLGEIIGSFLPDGAAKTLFSRSVEIGFDSTTLKLFTITFTIGLLIKLNFVSLLMVVLVLVYFRWWYL
ncbi:MAG: DUF4321 domain-containing protein [Limisphaerales bacterium]